MSARSMVAIGVGVVLAVGIILVPQEFASRADAIAAALAGGQEPRDKDLRHYLSLPIRPDVQAQGVAAIRTAQALAEQNKLSDANNAYDQAATLIPNLGDWVDLFAAGVAATRGDTAEVARRLAGLDSVLLNDWAWRTRSRAFRNANDRGTAQSIAQAAAENAGPIRRRAEGWQVLGTIALETGDSAAARTAFWKSMNTAPYSDIALESGRLLATLGKLQPDQHLAIGRTYLRFGNPTRALEGMDRYVKSPRANADTVGQIRLELGRYYFDADRYRDAERSLAKVTGTARPEALFFLGRTQYRMDRDAAGRLTLNSLVSNYPKHDASSRALFLLADLAHDQRRLDAAATAFRQVIEISPRSEHAGVSHMRLAAIALTKRDTAEALKRFELYREQFPRGARHQQATFWAARLHDEKGEEALANQRLDETIALDPLSFYGLQAATMRGTDGFVFEPDPVTSAATDSMVEAALMRIDALREVGWLEAAAFELQRVRSYFTSNPGALLSLAEGLNERGRTSSGITLGRELLASAGGKPSKRLMRVIYPFPYRDLISSAARQHNIDPFFMAALIRQESWFNPNATSGAGAMGLMQVMPATGRGLARSLGIRPFTSAMLHQPETNVRIGALFLADMIRTWGGRHDYVLAAYNAGPSRMARWRSFPEASDPHLFMERIPFDETRDYVRVVQLNTRLYHTLYGSGASANEGQK